MNKIMNEIPRLFYNQSASIIASRKFFLATAVVILLQGLWYAASFQPILFDEAKHIETINIFANERTPFLGEQKPEWDKIGNVAHNSSYLYYYLMSLPLQILQPLELSGNLQVVTLRIVSITTFLTGIMFLRKALLLVTRSPAIVNISILLFALIPAAAPLPGVVSYDVASFTIFCAILLLAVKLIVSKEFDVSNLLGVVALSGIASVIKYSAIALIIPILVSVVSIYLYRYKGQFLREMKNRFSLLSIAKQSILLVIVIGSVVVAVERPILNLIKYGDVTPSCVAVLSEERCYKDYVSRRNQDFSNSKPDDFSPINQFTFFYMYWIPDMIKTSAQQWPYRGPFPVVFTLMHIGFITLIVTSLVNIRTIARNKALLMFIVISLFYVATLFTQQYGSYVQLGQPVALSGRYLVPIFPLIILLMVISLRDLTSKVKLVRPFIIGATLVLLTQGGGVVTHALSVNQPEYYWDNVKVTKLNNEIKKALHPLVFE